MTGYEKLLKTLQCDFNFFTIPVNKYQKFEGLPCFIKLHRN